MYRSYRSGKSANAGVTFAASSISDVAAINCNAPLASSQQQASSHLVHTSQGEELASRPSARLRSPPRQSDGAAINRSTPLAPQPTASFLSPRDTSQGEEPASRPMGPSRHPRLGPRAHGRTEPGEPPAALRACPSISLDGTRRLSADSRPTHVGVTCDFFGSATGKAPVEITGSIHGPLAWVECIVSTLRSHPLDV